MTFHPAGVPACELATVVMTLDEFEAIRLADLAGLYQAEAAAAMGISRPTFARLVKSARRKVAETLVHGKALHIEGGPVAVEGRRCPRCAAGECATPDCGGCQRRLSTPNTQEKHLDPLPSGH